MRTPEERERDRATGQWHLQVMRRLERPRSRAVRLAEAAREPVRRRTVATVHLLVGLLVGSIRRFGLRRLTVARATLALASALVVAPWAMLVAMPGERPAIAAPPAPGGARANPWYARTAELLAAPGPEELKLALIDTLRSDPADAATRALVRGIDDASTLVAMASLRALSGRPCAAVGEALARGLVDAAWQRRAWAAKVLGENGCRAAMPRLAERLRVEQDPRVERHLTLALYTLGARAGR